MMKRNAAWFMPAALLMAGLLPAARPQGEKPKLRPVIRQVDHVLVQSSDPKPLLEFLVETLQLPVAWPVAEYSGFVSGGVAAGNVNIEVLRYFDQESAGPAARVHARFIGLALEPLKLADCLVELKARGIEHGPPEAYISTLPSGTRGTLWTNVVLPRLSKPNLSIFLCEYNAAFLHAEIRRNQLGGQLVLKQGGPLGIQSLAEIVIGARSLAADSAEWQRLLAPSAQSPATLWPAGRGPSVRMVADSSDGIRRIVFRVASLKAARAFLAENKLLGTASAGEITIRPASIQGLSIHLAER